MNLDRCIMKCKLFVLRRPAMYPGVMNPFRAFGPMAVWVATAKSELDNPEVISLILLILPEIRNHELKLSLSYTVQVM